MSIMRMAAVAAASAVLTVGTALPGGSHTGEGPQKPSFYVSWTARSDEVAAPGRGREVDDWGMALSGFVATSLDQRFPCGSTLTQGDAANLLSLEKDRQTLGVEANAEALAALGNAVGARYVVHLTLVLTGNVGTVSAAVVDSPTGKMVAHQTVTVPKGEGVVDALEAFGRSLASSLDARIPRCAQKDWTGKVTVDYSRALSGSEGSMSEERHISCLVLGEGSAARCSLSARGEFRGDKGAAVGTQLADAAETSVDVLVRGDKLTLRIGGFRVTRTFSAPNVPTSSRDEDFTGESYEVPAAKDPDNQMGAWVPEPSIPSVTLRVTWNLYRKPRG